MITDPLQARPDFQSGPESPTKPGVYWFHSETASRAMLVDVRVANGELLVWWPNQDQPVTRLNGHWRAPIPPPLLDQVADSHSSIDRQYHHVPAPHLVVSSGHASWRLH